MCACVCVGGHVRVYVCAHAIFIHSYVDGYLELSHTLSTVNCARKKKCEHTGISGVLP